MPKDTTRELLSLVKEAGGTVTFDLERDMTRPCFVCETTTTPRTLIDMSFSEGCHKRVYTRPFCPKCAEYAPDLAEHTILRASIMFVAAIARKQMDRADRLERALRKAGIDLGDP
jgi:hypothetical protein